MSLILNGVEVGLFILIMKKASLIFVKLVMGWVDIGFHTYLDRHIDMKQALVFILFSIMSGMTSASLVFN